MSKQLATVTAFDRIMFIADECNSNNKLSLVFCRTLFSVFISVLLHFTELLVHSRLKMKKEKQPSLQMECVRVLIILTKKVRLSVRLLWDRQWLVH